ncbi:hypothetical protein E2C01_057224 [Portunus trituberculatus]|uniref:Secreted protein n=1 Tax=Portunus trituberculatus TaxID=210409 RepID=A0A5B7GSV0_PORTR|nr:hypothetical protein [Portunus trituberculatus]
MAAAAVALVKAVMVGVVGEEAWLGLWRLVEDEAAVTAVEESTSFSDRCGGGGGGGGGGSGDDLVAQQVTTVMSAGSCAVCDWLQ